MELFSLFFDLCSKFLTAMELSFKKLKLLLDIKVVYAFQPVYLVVFLGYCGNSACF
jgi:hypothetical protein